MKIKRIIKFILIILVTIGFIQFISNNKVEAASKPNLKVSYSYDSKKDIVTVKVKSNVKLKKTKPSWTLSKDKKTYTKKFYTNQTYKTTFTATNGKSKTVKIKVNKIKGPKLTVSYKYDKNKNQVKVTVKSNKKYKNTKPTWTLSEKKYTYTKFFKANQTYKTTFYDEYGNKVKVKIKVTQLDTTAPKLSVSYKYNPDKKVMVVTVKANEKMKDNKSSWKLSSDKKVYTKEFSSAEKYKTDFYDLAGNKTKITIDVKKFDKTNPKATIKYSYNKNTRKATVKIISDESLADTKPTWTLSSDKKTYTKKFDSDKDNYSTTIEDLVGNKTTVQIKFDYSNTVYYGIDVAYHQGKINWEKVKESGINFAIIRCGYGKNVEKQDDGKFRYNIEECKRLSIPYGVYIYSYALNTEGAISEAEHVLRLIKGYNPEYGIWIDMEDADGYKEKNGMPSNEMLVNICDTFCQKIKKAGYKKVGVYANSYWFNNKLNDKKLNKYDKWLAHYPISGGKQTGNNTDPSKENANNCDIWQYTSDGSIDGISERVDMDYCYKRY